MLGAIGDRMPSAIGRPLPSWKFRFRIRQPYSHGTCEVRSVLWHNGSTIEIHQPDTPHVQANVQLSSIHLLTTLTGTTGSKDLPCTVTFNTTGGRASTTDQLNVEQSARYADRLLNLRIMKHQIMNTRYPSFCSGELTMSDPSLTSFSGATSCLSPTVSDEEVVAAHLARVR